MAAAAFFCFARARSNRASSLFCSSGSADRGTAFGAAAEGAEAAGGGRGGGGGGAAGVTAPPALSIWIFESIGSSSGAASSSPPPSSVDFTEPQSEPHVDPRAMYPGRAYAAGLPPSFVETTEPARRGFGGGLGLGTAARKASTNSWSVVKSSRESGAFFFAGTPK